MSSFLRKSTAGQGRALSAFVSDSDFKTTQAGLTIANTDIKLMKNGAASVNKNSGGGTHRINGSYGVTFDSTDTDTVGELEVSVVVAGALVVWKTFWVLEQASYDAIFASGAEGAATPTLAKTAVVAALNTDTYAEPGQENPPATTTLVKKLGYLYKGWRNKNTQTATEVKLYADDTVTVDQKATVSDDSTTLTKGEYGTGP